MNVKDYFRVSIQQSMILDKITLKGTRMNVC